MLYRRLFLALMVSFLAACGGGGGGDTPTPVTVPIPVPVPAPLITSQPASQTVSAGQPATFSVGVQDASGVSYQWLRNGTDIAGAGGPSYTLPSAQLGDSGSTWAVRVSNASGTVTSNAATLTVNAVAVQPPLGVSLFAGSLASPRGNADGTGPAAHFNRPSSLAVDAAGNSYVLDAGNATIRKVTPAGVVTTLAGVALVQGAVVDGTGSNARFNQPQSLALHSDGFLYVLDRSPQALLTDPGVLRRVSLEGVVTTLPQLAFLPYGSSIASGRDGFLYVAAGGAIYKFAPGGTPVLVAGAPTAADGYVDAVGSNARFSTDMRLAIDAQSTVYVGDGANRVVRKISPSGEVTTLAGLAGAYGFADGAGAAARFRRPSNPVLDPSGDILFTDADVVRRVTQAGVVTTPLRGGGGTALALGPAGSLLFISGDGIAKFDAAGTISNFAGDLVTPNGAPAPVRGVRSLSVDAQGTLYAFGTTKTYLPTGQPTERALLTGETPFDCCGTPVSSAVILERDGNFLVANGLFQQCCGINVVRPGGGAIYRVTPTATVNLLASATAASPTPYTPGSIAIDAAGTIYFTDFSTITLFQRGFSPGGLFKLATDGVVTRIGDVQMQFDFISANSASLAMSPAGTLYVVESTMVRKLDGQGNLVLVAGSPTSTGDIADGVGAAARLFGSGSPAFDAAGNLYIANRNTIRRITPDGVVGTIAGQFYSRGNTTGPLPASFGPIVGLAVGPDGLLHVAADNALLRIRLQ